MTLERQPAQKHEVLLERLGTFPWGEWQAQSDEQAGAKLHDLVHRRRLAIEFFDLVSDDGETVAALDKEGTIRSFEAIRGGPMYLEIIGSEEPTHISFFLRYYPLRIAQL
ncbi:MAG: hypothetical protein UZ00_C0001G0016 [Parcubacteria group bacterium GW2011_GWA1_60_11]|uniref:Uncharacterized protein n=2 Tax=Candidatus Liptoniibacteriota TaxID=1817909 RepID=A0A1G2CLN0_9BACT|nr:MAG: hypothetical protein UZ00_C0001G0016 [Parcubacteria group bacterium GW2011_GWA1_60_11]OGY98008.1 MAG: hypothetical protein A3E09_00545 [Candidatus Liptonbacteria bacterium RIFCSPHIGHO2_12_FULL_60_13]OGZ02112.1 MAG: hypothetical protein A3G64_01170 [Candidatus Liptonbacteria bacterium RIFCSPLOWO2_12_FULL_60_15]